MNLRPLNNNVAVELIKEETSAGGIVLTSKNTEPMVKARVVAVGPGHRDSNGNLHPMTLRIGDTVLLNRHMMAEVNRSAGYPEGTGIISESHVLAVISAD